MILNRVTVLLFKRGGWLSATSKAELRLPIPFALPPVSLGGGGGKILMRVPVKCLELVRIFKEANRNFRSTFRDVEDAKKFKKTSTPLQKVLIRFLRHSKILFISWHCPFKSTPLVTCYSCWLRSETAVADPRVITEPSREAGRVAETATGAAVGAVVASPNILTSRVKLKSNKRKKEGKRSTQKRK